METECSTWYFGAVLGLNMVLMVANGVVLAFLGHRIYQRTCRKTVEEQRPESQNIYEQVKFPGEKMGYEQGEESIYHVPKEIEGEAHYANDFNVAPKKQVTDYLPVIG